MVDTTEVADSTEGAHSRGGGVQITRLHWAIALAPLMLVVPAHMLVDARVAQWARGEQLQKSAAIQAATEIGESTWWLVGAAVLFAGFAIAKKHNAARWAFAFFVAIAGSGLAGNLLKLIFGKARPEKLFEAGFFGFTPFSYGHDVNSFPSGHATTFGALAMMFALLSPRFRWVCIALGAAGVSTRVLIQAHYVSDVCAGFSLGMVGALAVFVVWRRRWPTSVPVRGQWV